MVINFAVIRFQALYYYVCGIHCSILLITCALTSFHVNEGSCDMANNDSKCFLLKWKLICERISNVCLELTMPIVMCELDPQEWTSMKLGWSKCKKISFKRMYLKMSAAKWWPFGSRLDVSTISFTLTHFGLLAPYGVEDLGQHWLR